ncbi:MAG: DUF2807 domain-containing protein [Muribaculaceae bacterium]|nr:DUF2807 domain-containing protein [Muribaculaceae bacterium]
MTPTSLYPRSIYLVSLLLTLLSVTPVSAADPVPGEEVRNVGEFTAIQVQDSVNIVYRNDAALNGTVRWQSADKALSDRLIINNGKGKLKIQIHTEDFADDDHPSMPTLYVYSSRLSKVLNYSDAQIVVEAPAQCEQMEFSQIGNGSIVASGLSVNEIYAKVTAGMGTISLSGTCKEATFRMTGTGTIQADQLTCGDVRCRIFGGGTIGCCPGSRLSVTGIGSTKIYYTGTPEITHKGGGKLIPIN